MTECSRGNFFVEYGDTVTSSILMTLIHTSPIVHVEYHLVNKCFFFLDLFSLVSFWLHEVITKYELFFDDKSCNEIYLHSPRNQIETKTAVTRDMMGLTMMVIFE